MRKPVPILLLALSLSGCVTAASVGPKPAAWCGWQMRQEVAFDPGKEFNRALAWAKYGTPAPGPEVGAIVVWKRGNKGRGHVGKIVGQAEDGQWIVRSGNDGHELRERARKVSDAVAFRRP